MYQEFGISKELEELSTKVEQEVENVFKKIQKNCEENSLKVLQAFQKENIAEMHFGSTTGYGYADIGKSIHFRNTCFDSNSVCTFKARGYTT